MPLGAARLNTLSKVLTTTSAAATGLRALDAGNRRIHHQTITTKPASASAAFTLSFWYKFDSTSPTEIIFGFQSGTSNTSFAGGTELLFCEVVKGKFRLGSYQEWDIYHTHTGANPESSFGDGNWDGEWHHYLYAIDSSNNDYLYVDGNSASISGTRPSGSDTVHWNTFQRANIKAQWNDYNTTEGSICQLFVDNTFNDITQESVRQKFYKFGGAVDMGSDGTKSGLSQPLIFHHGDTSDFFDLGGDTSRFNYGNTQSGTADGDISADDGPQINSRQPAIWANGGFSSTSSGVFNNALQLSAGGSSGEVQLPSGSEFDDNVARTLEFRFKISDGGTSNKTTKIFSTGGITNDNFPTSSNTLTLHTYSNGNLYFTHDGSEANLGSADTSFHHVAMQYDGTGSFHLWLDGTHKVSATHSISQTTNLTFGNRRAGEGSNSGTNTIDEIRVSSTTRYPHNTNNITVPTSAFTSDDDTIALFHMESTTQTDDQS